MQTKRAAKAIIIDPKGYVLQLRRSETHPQIPFTPDLPGGTIDENEDARTTLARELMEEIGVDIAETSVISFKTDQFSAYGKKIELELFEVSGFEDRPEIKLSFEHDRYDWLPVDQLSDAGFFKQLVVDYVESKAA